jgi:hypothetical protein
MIFINVNCKSYNLKEFTAAQRNIVLNSKRMTEENFWIIFNKRLQEKSFQIDLPKLKKRFLF